MAKTRKTTPKKRKAAADRPEGRPPDRSSVCVGFDQEKRLLWVQEEVAELEAAGVPGLRDVLERNVVEEAREMLAGPRPPYRNSPAEGVDQERWDASELAVFHAGELYGAVERGELAAAVMHALWVGRAWGTLNTLPTLHHATRRERAAAPNTLRVASLSARAAKRAQEDALICNEYDARRRAFPKESPADSKRAIVSPLNRRFRKSRSRTRLKLTYAGRKGRGDSERVRRCKRVDEVLLHRGEAVSRTP